jgi:hypothetical protein
MPIVDDTADEQYFDSFKLTYLYNITRYTFHEVSIILVLPSVHKAIMINSSCQWVRERKRRERQSSDGEVS